MRQDRKERCIIMINELNVFDENINPVFEEIRDLINSSRNRLYIAVNT